MDTTPFGQQMQLNGMILKVDHGKCGKLMSYNEVVIRWTKCSKHERILKSENWINKLAKS